MLQRCPSCGHENPPGLTICTACATALVNACPRCGFENPAGFNFCGNCGVSLAREAPAEDSTADDEEAWKRLRSYIPEYLVEKLLASRGRIEGERRNVTVLFADLQGFTTLSEKMDPERVYDLLGQCMHGFADEIHRYEGTIDKFIGDGVMALFGAPLAHENDPERAVRAGLGMLAFLRTFNRRLEREYGISLHMRIGLNAGPVIAGTVGSDLRMQYTVIGDTVNLASRLEEQATPDSILVSESVWAATAPLVDYLPRGPITVKGREMPVETYEVIGLKSRPGQVRGVHGLRAPLVGRTRELAQMRQVIADLALHGRGQVVLLTGEGGMGKTRLVAESKPFMERHGARVLEATCRSHATHTSYWLIRQLLIRAFGLQEGDDDTARRRKTREGVQALMGDEAQDVIPLVQRLLDIPIADKQLARRVQHLAAEQLRRQTFLALRRLMLAAARARPLIVIVDDLHWVDRASLNLILFLIPLVEQAPVLFCLISRPYEGQAAPTIHSVASEISAAHYLNLPLTKLSLADTRTLVDALLHASDLPPHVHEAISEKAEGTPFFLEEIVRLLIEQGAIWRADGKWQAQPDLDLNELGIPHSLHALLMSRVDRLPEEPKHVLQCCAVVGPRVPLALLRAAVGDENRDILEPALRELTSREFLDLESEQDKTYAFRHTLVRETVYGMLLTPRRRKLHRRVGYGLEEMYAGRLDEVVDLLAYHFGEAAHAERAMPYTIRAAERAMDRFDYEQAATLFERAREYFREAPPSLDQELRVYAGLGDVGNYTGDYDAALRAYDRALAIQKQRAGPDQHRRVAEQLRKIGRTWERKADYDEALRWLGLALAELDMDPRTARVPERARVYNDMGWVNYRQGQSQKARSWAVRALEILEGTEYYQDIASAYNRLVAVYYQTGQWKEATEFAEKSLKLREQIGYTYGVASSLSNLAALLIIQGAWDRALESVQRSLKYSEEMGDAEGVAVAYNNLGLIYRDRGDFAQAEQSLNRSLEVAGRIRNPLLMAFAYTNLGHLALVRGRHRNALGFLQRSRSLAAEVGSQEQVAEIDWLTAEARLGLGEIEEAIRLAEEAAVLARRVQSRNNEGAALRVAGLAYLQRGDLPAAEEHLEASCAIYDSLQHPFELAKSRLGLAELRARQGCLEVARDLLEQAEETFGRLRAMPALDEVRRQLAVVDEALAQAPSPAGHLQEEPNRT
jgi:class 3 adenylate cyclase/tetratricopeptide (TPR) repeat protein